MTALLAWLAARSVGGRLEFMCYAAQNIVKPLPLPLRVIQNFLFKRCAAILACGAEQADVLRAHGYQGRIIHFPLWYDRSRFQLAPRDPAAPLTVGFAGALSHAKGLDDLLAAFGVVDPHLAGAAGACAAPLAGLEGVSLKIAGGGDSAAVTYLSAQCEAMRAAGVDAEFCGALALDAMPAFYRSLDVLVVPSRTTAQWKEQFGRVIIEAMACGVVVVGSRSGEIPRVIGDPERTFAEGEPSDLARVVGRALAPLREPQARAAARVAVAEAARRLYADDVLADALAGALGV